MDVITQGTVDVGTTLRIPSKGRDGVVTSVLGRYEWGVAVEIDFQDHTERWWLSIADSITVITVGE